MEGAHTLLCNEETWKRLGIERMMQKKMMSGSNAETVFAVVHIKTESSKYRLNQFRELEIM